MIRLFKPTPPGDEDDALPAEEPCKTAQVVPDWQGDLDSLFTVVDRQMVDRRVAWVSEPSPPTAPSDLWVGFGIEDRPDRSGSVDSTVGPDAPQLLAAMRSELRELVMTAARESFTAALQEQMRRSVKEAVDTALREAAEDQRRARSHRSRRTVVSIRFHRPLFAR